MDSFEGVIDSRMKKKTEDTSTFERSRSEGALSRESNANCMMRQYIAFIEAQPVKM